VQDVPAAVVRRGLSFQDYLDVGRPAVLDAEHCVRLNYEAFFFADATTRERFLAEPRAYCGLLTDPVSKRRFRPCASSEQAEHAGVTYWFEEPANRARFEADPEMFRLPRWVMPPKGGSEASQPAGSGTAIR
jgi:YHS domain-containing protein